ncbi:MAG: hypothetical protein EOO10_20740 [Chitinophagaceae bacterium]|nr:MAG: hypothetical protein EOO10_20740 [Chitinophagaceae bacterium]
MKRSLLTVGFLISLSVSSQVQFSLATGLSGLRNFSPQQKFWAIGQTLQVSAHFSPTQGAYASLDYYTEGKFKNNFTATAKSLLTTPQQLSYMATGRLTYRQISLGLKHYFKGAFNTETGYNVYGLAGFGLLFAQVGNSNSIAVDTTLYQTQAFVGEGAFRKLTFDLGIGGEVPIGGNFFLFADGRTWLPASSKTASYLHNQKNVPLPFMLSAGMRILFASY